MAETKEKAILKWILILTFSRVSGYVVVKFENLNEKLLLDKVLNVLKDTDDRNNLGLRKSNDVNDYMNRKLVKRVIPHGYEIKHLEYDKKYKTLYKPLVRIHKRKPAFNFSSSNENENRYDLMFVINDKYYKDVVNLAKDDSLLEPFAIDTGDIKYLPSENRVKKIIVEKKRNYDYDYLKPIRYKPIDYSEPLKGHVNQYDKEYDANENVNTNHLKLLGLLKYNFGKQSKNIKNNLMKSNSNKYKLVNQIDRINLNLDKRKGTIGKHNSDKLSEPDKVKKQLWFGPIGHLNSKHIQDKNDKLNELDTVRSYGDEKPAINNLDDLIDSIKQLIQERNEIQTKKESSGQNDPYRWFGPIGQFPRELKEKETNKFMNTLEKPNIYKHEFRNNNINPKQDMNNFANSLKKLIETQTERVNFMESYSKKELLGSKGHNEKKYKQNDRDLKDVGKSIPFDYNSLGEKIKLKEKKGVENVGTPNKLKQLSRKAKLKDSQLETEERYSLRLKSGEDDAPTPMVPWVLLESTTDANVHWKPQYPFWNYWTYDKTIHLDDCKGNLIQSGRLCIEPI